MNVNTSDNGRRCSIIILSVTIVFILSTVIIGLCVRFLTEGTVQRVILIVLICVLSCFGMVAVIVLEIRRRRSLKKRAKAAKPSPKNYQPAPTAPPLSNPSSWNYSKNYSNRTTIQA